MTRVMGNSNHYETEIKVVIMTTLLCTWAKNEKKESILEISNIAKEILSKDMVKLLTNF